MLHTISDRDPILYAQAAMPASAATSAQAGQTLLQRLQALPELPGALPLRQRVPNAGILLHEGAPARQICVVLAGTFKSVKTGDDGYEHVLGFAMRGDLLGYDGLASGRYASAAMALEDSVVFALPLRQFDQLRHTDAHFDRALQAALSRQMSRAIELAELMSAVAADARLARFLLYLSSRMSEHGMSARRLLLRMNRREIASHLGVAHETVSRSFGLLADRGYLRVDNRAVEIVDLEGLRLHAHCTRGPTEEGSKDAQPADTEPQRTSSGGMRPRLRATA